MPKRGVASRQLPAPPKSVEDTRRILARLAQQHPDADTELHFSNAYELLVATILSAQCTDERVNQVTPALFERYPHARALARATTSELEPQIQSTGFFRAKARALVAMAGELVERFGGEIPRRMEDLVTLAGVGRKTANVVLGHALGVPGLPVDRHVLRVANRIGIARAEDPEVVEHQLCAALPPAEWTQTSDTLILHGRRICKPRPLCDRCAVRDECNYFRSLRGVVVAAGRRSRSAGGRVRSRELSRPLEARNVRATGQQSASVPRRASSGQSQTKSRAPKARGQIAGMGLRRDGSESGQSQAKSRAPKARGQIAGMGLRRDGSESGQSQAKSRAPKARGQVVGVGPHDKLRK